MNAQPDKKSLLPEIFTRPSLLAWVMLLPQLLLLVLNLRGWDLVQGEMDAAQRGMALTLFTFQSGLFVVGLLAVIWLLKRGLDVRWWFCAAMLLLHVAYLWLVTSWVDKLLPDTVTLWIYTPSQFMYYQYALMMPMLFYSGLRLSCFPLPLGRPADLGITLATLVGVPVVWFILLQVLGRLASGFDLPEIILMILLVGSTLLILIAFLRFLFFLYALLNRIQRGQIVLLCLAGLAAPIGGLLLNMAIPFPYNFQDGTVYLLTIINGIVLMLPSRPETRFGMLTWVARSIMYSFSLYFFIVFLPFLPLSLLAMIACGAGFLILAPTFLFIVHTRQLLQEGKALAARLGKLRVMAVFICCLLSIPAAYTVRALADKAALMQAVDAVYSPDYRQGKTRVNRLAARRSLARLKNMKEGIFVPFLSDYYNHLVFGSMVLPDHKMEAMHLTLFGEPVPDSRGGIGLDLFGRGRGGSDWSGNWRQGRVRPPERRVQLSETTVTSNTTNDIVHASVTLTLENQGGGDSEFRTDIVLPDGVLCTGYWLDVEGTRVPGRIFEKKTAMWVYHMIRDTERRDPGLLVYKSDERLRLNVYPFASKQTRVTGIDFQFPEGMTPDIQVGSNTVALTQSDPDIEKVLVFSNPDSPTHVVVPETASARLPAVTRGPYLHLLIDCSANAQAAFETLVRRARGLAEEISGISHCRVTFVNYDHEDLGGGLMPLDSALDTLAATSPESLRFRGAFCPERAIRGMLLALQDAPVFDEAGLPLVPLFVALSADESTLLLGDDLSAFARATPDFAGAVVIDTNDKLHLSPFDAGREEIDSLPPAQPVHLFRVAKHIRACAAGTSALLTFPEPGEQHVEVFDPTQKKFVRLVETRALSAHSVYARGLGLWHRYRLTVTDPRTINDRLPGILEDSRDTGVIVPLTSYMVVENSAQWKILERKEAQALNADHALEFDEHMESPAPPILFLLPVVLLMAWRRKR